jgi:serine phosphatase RsbU (regulator of sigma subunit)
LPFGIDDEISMHTYQLENGDLILMSSDGVFENVVEEEEFENFISNIKNYPPQRIVYEILNYTLNHKIQTKDDMSIVALKVQNVA